jgi:septal ring factor EnvC (AmiA/AmiB activator)
MGEPVALVGSTGSIEGPMLYFEIRYHGTAVDPLTWLALPNKGQKK